MRAPRTAVLVGAALVAAAGIPRPSFARDVVAIPLRSGARNAGDAGTAILVRQGEYTVIALIVGVPPWVGRPVRLYTFMHRGTCGRHEVAPELSLNEGVVPEPSAAYPGRGPYTLKKRVAMPLAALRSEEHALVVRSSPADGDVELYCADMNGPADTAR